MKASAELLRIREEQRALCLEREAGREDLFRDVDEFKDIPYRNDSDPRHSVDVYSPVKAGKAPVIVVIHGGGYIACEKEINRIQARWFARQGFKVINGEYTLYPEADSRVQLQELSDIFNWMSVNSERYGFDTDRVYLTGDSAGGHLVLLYTMVQSNDKLRDFFRVTLPAVRVRATAASCPLDAARYIDDPHSAGVDDPIAYISRYMFPEGVSDEMVRNLDIKHLISFCEFPPLFVFTSPSDEMLGEYTGLLQQPLEESGREFLYKVYEDGDHQLEHVWNVTWPEWDESIEANTDIINYFRSH